jgi:hypothetical protein
MVCPNISETVLIIHDPAYKMPDRPTGKTSFEAAEAKPGGGLLIGRVPHYTYLGIDVSCYVPRFFERVLALDRNAQGQLYQPKLTQQIKKCQPPSSIPTFIEPMQRR